MQGRRRIRFVINSLAGGGAERVLTTVLAASVEEGRRHDLGLVLLDDEPAAYRAPDWLPVRQLDCGGSMVRSVRRLHGVLRDEKPDLTVSFLTRANVASVVVAKLLGHRAVISERVHTSSHLGQGLRAGVSKAMVRWTYPFAEHVIAVSDGVADDLVAHFAVARGRVASIPNPVDTDMIRRRAAEPAEFAVQGPYCVAIGRLTATKNFAMLLEAYALADIPQHLVIMGQGPEEAALRAQASGLGLAGRVTLAGFVANPFAVMRNADFYVSPSNAEGFPNSLVEAMALRLPVISTNCASGPSEILAGKPRSDVSGLSQAAYGVLVPEQDPQTMAEALKLIANPVSRARYGEAAGRRAEEYGIDRARLNYWAAIERALDAA